MMEWDNMNPLITASFSSFNLYGNILPLKNFIAGAFNTLSRRPTAFPLSINMLITRHCNYACQMCVSSQCGKIGDEQDVGLSVIGDLVREVRRYRPVFHIGGGEPLTRKDMPDILALIRQNGLKCLMTTNGFLMKGRALESVATNVDVPIISLYGPREVHDKIVGIKGAFERTVEHLKSLLKKRRRGQRIIVSCIAMPESLNSFSSFLTHLHSLGIDAVKIEHLNFLTSKEYAAAARSPQNEFDLTPAMFLEDRTFQESFVEGLVRLKKMIPALDMPVYMKPYLSDQQIRDWYHSVSRRDPECRFITHSVFINYNGDIIPCQFLPRCVLGNIRKDSLKDIWNSKTYRKLRKTIKEVCPKVCMRCCKN